MKSRNDWIELQIPAVKYGYVTVWEAFQSIIGERLKKTFELLTLRALQFSPVNKIHIFQCIGKIFCVEFQRYHLKFHTKYLSHILNDMNFIQHWHLSARRFKSSYGFLKRPSEPQCGALHQLPMDALKIYCDILDLVSPAYDKWMVRPWWTVLQQRQRIVCFPWIYLE